MGVVITALEVVGLCALRDESSGIIGEWDVLLLM